MIMAVWGSLSVEQLCIQAFLIILVTALVYFLGRRFYRYQQLPPGPFGLPILGYLPFVDRNLPVGFRKLSQKYGDIFSLKFGQRFIIVLSSWNVIKEFLIKNGDLFSVRPLPFNIFGHFTDYKGFFNSEGNAFKEQKKFLLNALRDSGLSQSHIERNIQEEAQNIMKDFEDLKGRPIDLSVSFKIMVTNVISAILFGKRFDYADQILQRFCRYFDELMELVDGIGILEAFPVLSLLPAKINGIHKLNKLKIAFDEFIEEIIKEHIDTMEDLENAVDVIHLYLKAMKEKGIDFNVKDNGTMFCRADMLINIRTLFITGVETTSCSLLWAIKLMMINPEVQKKVQEEIDRVLGTRPPSWVDRSNLPYTTATFYEITRMSTFVPLPPARSNAKEVVFKQYTIPERSFILTNIWQVHFDPKLWRNPETFNPSRFIDSNGKAFKPEYLIPFNVGNRSCLGESMAKMEIFLFFTYFLQNFSFRSCSEDPETLDLKPGFERKLMPFEVVIEKRSRTCS